MTLGGSSAPTKVDQPPWSDANHWNQPQYYLTIHAADVNQDGKAELLGRGSGGIDTWVFDAATAQWQLLAAGACGFTDANKWNQPQYYLTIQAADIDGDGKAEVIGRGSGGIETWSFDPATGQWAQLGTGACNWTDANGWNAPQYYSTIRAADIDGDGQAELLGRGANGIDTWRFDVATKQWQPVSIGTCNWTDANRWNLPQYYGAIVVADIDGDGCAELMGRGEDGVDTWKFSVADQQWQQLNAGACNWTDANGWDAPQYYSTIQAADVDGDGRAELVGRGANGIDTWRFDVSTQQWQPVSIGTCNWTDANKWNQVQYYATIQAADLNGDGQAELLGRGSGGIDVWRFDVASGEWVALAVATGEWTDANKWNQAQYYRTIQCADVNGDRRAELMCRTSNGMETWVYNGATAGWQQPAPLITVDARLMENYVQGGVVSGGQQIVAATNGDGQVETFSIGTDGQVYEIYPDPTSDTGWSQVAVGVTATVIAAGLTAPQGPLALVAGQTSGAQCVVQNPVGSATRWGAPVSLDVTGPVTQLVAQDNGGELLLVGVVAQTSSTAAQAWLTQWLDGQLSATASSNLSGPANAAICAVLDRSYNEGNPGNWQSDFLAMWGTQVVLDIGHLGATSDRSGGSSPTAKTSAARPAVVDVATTIDAHQQSVYYAVLADGNLYSQTVPLSGSNNQLAWKNQLTSQGGTQNVALAGVTAWADASGGQHLLVTDRSGRVYDYDASDSGAPLVDLGVTAAQLAGCPDASGVQQLFVVGPGTGALSTMWTDADTGDWATAPVELQSIGGMQSVISYTTEITVRDAIGQAVADSPVTIWSDDLVALTVNGAAVWVDVDQPCQTTANAAGQVTVMAAAGTLDTPLLKVATGTMAAGAAVVIEPNLDVQGRLRTVTDQQLLNPTDIFGDPLPQPLLSGDFATEQNAQQIANIVTQSMTLVAPATGSSAGPDRAMVRGIAQSDPRFSRRIDLASVPDQHWRVDCSSGAPVFTTLTPDAAQALLADKQAGLDAGTFLGIDWGDVWDAVTETVGDIVSATTELLDLVVTTVANGVQVAITCVIDGLTYVYKGIISLVEQAFDIVAGIFAAIGTAFDTLFQWLGFLFDWPDIVRTQQVVTFVYGQAMALLPTALTRIQTMINDQILQYETQLQDFISSLVQGRLGSQDLAAIQASAPVAPDGLEFSAANNVVNTAFLNNVADSPLPASATLTADVAGPFDTLIANIQQYAQQFEVGDNFSQAVDYFTAMAEQLTTQPDQALQSLLSGLLEVVGGLAQVGMETARLVVNVVLGSISEIVAAATGPGGVLAFDWPIPFVSDLYQYVTGSDDPLTPLDLMALVVAVPATVFAKVTTGAAPFPDDASVAAFQQQFTAQALLDLMPGATDTGPTAAPAAVADAGWPDFSPTGLEFLYIINLLSDMAYGFSSAGADVQKVNPVPVKATGVEFGMSIACVVAEGLIFFSGCPGWALTAPTNKAWIVWGLGATGLGTDTMMLIATQKVTQLNQDVGVIVSLIEGIEIVALYAIWEATEGCPWQTMVAGMLSAAPLLFKPLRLLVVDQLNVLGVPVAPANRIALAAIDGIGLVLSGLFGFFGAVEALNQVPAT